MFFCFFFSCSQVLGNPNFPPVGVSPCVLLATVPLVNPYSVHAFFIQVSAPRAFHIVLVLFGSRVCRRLVVVGLWWWGCLFRSFFLALLHLAGLLGKLREACAPAKPPAPPTLALACDPSPVSRWKSTWGRAGVKVGGVTGVFVTPPQLTLG